MERPLSSRHRIVNPESLARPRGYAHAVVAQPGETIFLAGQTASRADGTLVDGSIAEQFEVAAANVVTALKAAGGNPDDLVSMQIFVTDIEEYLASRTEVGEAYRRHFGNHFPAMALLEVRRLFDPAARVELMCVAVRSGAG